MRGSTGPCGAAGRRGRGRRPRSARHRGRGLGGGRCGRRLGSVLLAADTHDQSHDARQDEQHGQSTDIAPAGGTAGPLVLGHQLIGIPVSGPTSRCDDGAQRLRQPHRRRRARHPWRGGPRPGSRPCYRHRWQRSRSGRWTSARPSGRRRAPARSRPGAATERGRSGRPTPLRASLAGSRPCTTMTAVPGLDGVQGLGVQVDGALVVGRGTRRARRSAWCRPRGWCHRSSTASCRCAP